MMIVELDAGVNIEGYQKPFVTHPPANSTGGPSAYSGDSGGYYSGTRGGGSGFYNGLSSSGSSPTLDHFTLRQNARSAFHDSSMARSIVERYADTVVDRGLRLESTPDAEVLGISDEQAEDWSRDVETRFNAWARSKNSTANRSMNFYQAQRMAEVFQQRDNDYFARFTYSNEKDLVNPLQIGFIDPNQIGPGGFTSTYAYNAQDDGIIRNKSGREIAYKVSQQDPKTLKVKEVEIPAFDKRTGRIFMIHGYQAEYAGQTRGYPRYGHMLQELENAQDFILAQIKKAINQSNTVMYVKPSADKPSSDPWEGMSSNSAAPVVEQFSSDDATGSQTPEAPANLRYQPLPEVTYARPGSAAVVSLDSGEELKPFENTAPSAEFDSFINSFMSYLSASMSIPMEVLKMQFGQNYSASRGALLLYWSVAKIWRDELACDFLNPVYESWLSGEIGAGRVRAPGWSDPIIRSGWLNNNWIGSSVPNIDPNNAADAAEKNLMLGLTHADRESRDLNGSTAKANMARLEKQYGEKVPPPWPLRNPNTGGQNG